MLDVCVSLSGGIAAAAAAAVVVLVMTCVLWDVVSDGRRATVTSSSAGLDVNRRPRPSSVNHSHVSTTPVLSLYCREGNRRSHVSDWEREALQSVSTHPQQYSSMFSCLSNNHQNNTTCHVKFTFRTMCQQHWYNTNYTNTSHTAVSQSVSVCVCVT